MMKTTGRLFLFRHGETAYNASDGERIRGRSNVPLTDGGRKGAKAAAKFLEQFNIKRIVFSPLPRTEETAKILREATDARIVPDDGLLSWDLGILTGKPVEEAYPMVHRLETHPTMQVPDGEPYEQWYNKWTDALWKYIEQQRKGVPNTVLVTHARNLTSVAPILKERAPQALDWAHAPEPESVLEVDVDDDPPTVELIRGKYQDKTLRS